MNDMNAYPKIYLYQRIVQAKLFIDANFAEKIDLNNIADEAHFSKFHFIRLFKSIYGKTPHQYLITVRIDKAKALLQTSAPVSEVCLMVGFDSVTSFTALFKRYTKVTPALFQQQLHERNNLIKLSPLEFVPNCFVQQHGWAEKSNFEEEP